jgi:1-aminocyclopropane-1-carboxylate deaminase/D-cysteine desulfhydrase-like pyridoxal-dependent ACC family enzyme
MKREDYASNLYGGNKVRSLEYQLACASAMLEKEKNGVLCNVLSCL